MDNKMEMDILDGLDEIRTMNARMNNLDPLHVLETRASSQKKTDEEMETLKKLRGELKESKDEKLTGKKLFESNLTLITSDALDKDDEDVEATELQDYAKEEVKEEEEEEDSERTRKLFYYNEDLFEGDVDIDEES